MAAIITLYAGTVGQGAWRSDDLGETFERCSAGMFMETEVRALTAHPQDPELIYAGTNAGIYRSRDGAGKWERLDAPFDVGKGWPAGATAWSLLVHPRQPNLLYVGTCPPALYRSRDGGASWEKLDAGLSPECEAIIHPRVTCLAADPVDDAVIWAGVEIDGIRRSPDGGETWERLDEGLSSQDIHSMVIVPGETQTIIASTNNDLNISTDNGATWRPQGVKDRFSWGYCRGMAQKADDPQTIFLGNGNGPPGSAGAVQVSRDGGRSWQAATLKVPPNSTIWTFATHPADPSLLWCASVSGYLYRSQDAGATWEKCRHEFGEVRALAWTPGPSL